MSINKPIIDFYENDESKRCLQLRSSISDILRKLFFSNLAEIPEDDSAIMTSTSKNCFLMWMPGYGSYIALVADQGMQWFLNISHVPDTNGLISRTSCEDEIGGLIESNRIDGIIVCLNPESSLSVFC